MRQFGILWAVLAALFIAGCGGDSIKSPTFTQVLLGVSVDPAVQSTSVGRTAQFTAVGEFSLPPGSATATEERPIEVAQWTSSNTAVATIDETGTATGLSAGSTQIRATVDGITSAPATLNVGDAVVESITITPANPTVSLGNTVVLSATGTRSDGSTGPVSVNWSSSSTGTVTVAPASGPSTTATGVSQGGSTITASLTNADGNPVQATTTVTVGPFQPILQSIVVTPDPATQPVGRPVQFVAAGTCSTAPGAGSPTAPCPATVTWSSANPAIAVVDAQNGVATGQMVGTTLITATAANGVFDSATFIVTEAVLDRVVIAPANPSVAVGATVALTASAVFTDGRLEPASATWSVESLATPDLVTFDPNPAVTTQVLGVEVGTGVITATLTSDPTFSGETSVTVTDAELQSLSRIVPATAQVNPGRSVEFTLLGNFSGGTEQPIDDSRVTWISGSPEFASIDGNGIATGVANGQTLITATAMGIDGSRMATLNVTDSQCTTPLLASDGAQVTQVATGACIGCTVEEPGRIIDASPATFGTALVPVGLSNQATLSAIVTAADNANYTLPFAGGNNAGFVIGRPAGLLSAEVLERIQVSTLLNGVVQETTGDTDLLLVDLLGMQLLDTGDSSDLALVSLQTSLPYDAISLTVLSGAAAVLSDVQVFQACGTTTPPVQPGLIGLSRIEPIAPTIVRGQARNLIAFGTVAGGAEGPTEVEIADADLNWTSSNPAVATVDALGVVTALETGTATITATLKDTVASSGSARSAVSNVTVVAGVCTVPFSSTPGVTATQDIDGLCLFCNVTNEGGAIDPGPGALLTAATVSVPVGLLGGSASLNVLNPIGSTAIPGGDFTGFVLSRPLNPLLQLELLDSIEISTLRRTGLGPVVVETSTAASQSSPLRLGLLGLELVDENELVLAGFRTTLPYDGIRVTFNAGVASALSNFLVFESCAVAEPTLLQP